MTGRLPRWLRVLLVVAIVALVTGAGLYSYRYSTRPTTLTVAAGSIDGESLRVMSAIAARLREQKSSVQLNVVDKGTALDATKAFAAGQADLVVTRDDAGDLSAARTVLVITHGVVLIVVPPGSTIDSVEALKGKTVGVIGGEINRPIVQALTKEYDLDGAKVQFKPVTPVDVKQVLKAKQVQALLVVMPISDKYLAILRGLFPRNGKQTLSLIPIESAGAIAAVSRAYESYDLPKGSISGSPAIPDEDLTTLRVPFYLVANRKVDKDVITTLTKAIMDTRRDLISEFPLLAQISAPSTDKDAYIPVHPGAQAYFDGDQKSFFDKYGDQLFYGTMLIGALSSLFVGAWRFMLRDEQTPETRAVNRLYALTDRIANAGSEADLADVEQHIDEILKQELTKTESGESEASEAAVLSLATHRLEYLISQRRKMLEAIPAPAARG